MVVVVFGPSLSTAGRCIGPTCSKNGQDDHFGQNEVIQNWTLAFMDQDGPFRSEELGNG